MTICYFQGEVFKEWVWTTIYQPIWELQEIGEFFNTGTLWWLNPNETEIQSKLTITNETEFIVQHLPKKSQWSDGYTTETSQT